MSLDIEKSEIDVLRDQISKRAKTAIGTPGFADQRKKIDVLTLMMLTLDGRDKEFIEGKMLLPELEKANRMLDASDTLRELNREIEESSWILSCEELFPDWGEAIWRIEQDLRELRRRFVLGDYIADSGSLEPKFRDFVIRLERRLTDISWQNWEKRKK